tara:strand:- start:11269 stop:12138 length:870 start_codon:yes stop_codon:yes gene_type:complete
MSFSQYKKNHKAMSDKLGSSLNKMNKTGYQQEEGFWSPTIDKAGNGWATIRFLPAVAGEEDPFISIFSYSFQGPTGLYYIENSRTTLAQGEPDPVDEMRAKLWHAKNEVEAKKYPRTKRYISNILVVKDNEHPENNGKVFYFKYGKQIADKINSLYKPVDADDGAIDAFNLYEGANFKLIVNRKDKFPTYENSKFEAPSPVAKTDKEIEAIYDQLRPLKPLVADDKFKSYDELAKKLKRVLGGKPTDTVLQATKAESHPSEELGELSGSDPTDDLDTVLKNIEDSVLGR